MITREQVADLQPGDVVEMRRDDWPEGAFIRSPLWAGPHPIGKCLYVLEGHFGVRDEFGAPYAHVVGLTVVSRAPRPLYVNHPRTEPVAGDVVRIEWDDAADDNYVNAFMPRRRDDPEPWVSLGTCGHGDAGERYTGDQSLPTLNHKAIVRLLVDGETGQVVP